MINFTIISISILISVAFFTMLERKILSYMQIRKGPNKVGMIGILQPFADALKLFNKNLITQELMNLYLSSSTPALTLIISLMIIPLISYNKLPLFDVKHSILMFFILSSMSVYSILMIGWSANSKYCLMGSVRSVAQMISYEVSFFLIILSIVFISNSYSFTEISKSQNILWFIFGNYMLFMIWITSCLAETNRSPFDFAEGESELVSGFNVEYMGGWFALIFLAEYMSMLILSMISIILFFNSLMKFTSMIMLIMTAIIMIWVRATLPRFRYDMLMSLSWKIFLPTSLFLISLISSFTLFFY